MTIFAMYAILSSVVLLAFVAKTHAAFGVNDAARFLDTYNYYDNYDRNSGNLRSLDDLTIATRKFQRMNGLDETGELDAPTLELMQTPRCGLPDNTGTGNRARRYALGDYKWEKTDLTWKIINRTPDLPDERTVDRIMQSALQRWADVSQLTFRQVQSGSADIEISFATGSHRDGNPFDGTGGVLAHAYFPTPGTRFDISGDAHFDEAEYYTDGVYSGTNLFQVAVHEFGHSLGLGHSNDPNAIMAAFYRGYIPNAQLRMDDIAGIQALYGANSEQPEVTGTETSRFFGQCGNAEFIAAAETRTMGSYLFNRTHAHLLDSVNAVVESPPQPIRSLFPGLPNNLDAAFYWEDNGKTYFFKGSQYWRFDDLSLDNGYPNTIQAGFGSEVPSNIDAAFVWSGNGRIYFIKGDQYYRYNSRIGNTDVGYPRPLSVWNGLDGLKIDAAFQFNKETYFFTGQEHRKFDDETFTVPRTYPLPSTRWLSCEESQIMLSPGPTNSTGNDAAVFRGSVGLVTVLTAAIWGLTQLLRI